MNNTTLFDHRYSWNRDNGFNIDCRHRVGRISDNALGPERRKQARNGVGNDSGPPA